MTHETLMHIDETLDDRQLHDLQEAFGADTHFHSTKPHLLFVNFDPERVKPHELIAAVERQGVHAQLIDF